MRVVYGGLVTRMGYNLDKTLVHFEFISNTRSIHGICMGREYGVLAMVFG